MAVAIHSPRLTILLAARSISRPAREVLGRTPFAARVLAAFDHACDLVTPCGEVIAVVAAEVGDGPLNIVVDGEFADLGMVQVGAPAWLEGGVLRIGSLSIDLAHAVTWEPVPDWPATRARRSDVLAALPALHSIALAHASEPDLLSPGSQKKPDRSSETCQVSEPTLHAAIRVLQSAWAGDAAALHQAATRLAGLGPGLTPAGDDFLAGVMLRAWLDHPDPAGLCAALAEAAAPRTTTLSGALLWAAARGECTAAWHALLHALAAGGREALLSAVQSVLAHGATSGADMLAGFLALSG